MAGGMTTQPKQGRPASQWAVYVFSYVYAEILSPFPPSNSLCSAGCSMRGISVETYIAFLAKRLNKNYLRKLGFIHKPNQPNLTCGCFTHKHIIEQAASNESSFLLKIFFQNTQSLQLFMKIIKTEIIFKSN